MLDSSLIDRIIALAQADDDIRSVILEGSLVVRSHVDALSDYDINIFSRDFDRYLSDDGWMSQFGDVLVYQKEMFQFYGAIIPTRLVIFRDRPRVDFSFWRISLLTDLVQGFKEYESYRNGYRVLVDKDQLARQLPAPDGLGFSITRPSRDEFLQTIYDFWFEACCVAKYLVRQDLWYAKLIENRYIKDHLYRMALWQHGVIRGWQPDPFLHLEGKRFEKWASPELVRAFAGSFSAYDSGATWKSLFAMLELFHHLARQTASVLQIQYPARVEAGVLEYLRQLSG